MQDTRTLRVAQDEAKALLAKDPNLIDPAHRALSDEVERLFETGRGDELVTFFGFPLGGSCRPQAG